MKKYNNLPLFQEKRWNFLFCLIWSNEVFSFPTLQIWRFFKVSEPYEEIDRANGKIDHKIEQLYFTFVIFKSSSSERMLCLFVFERLPSDFHARTS